MSRTVQSVERAAALLRVLSAESEPMALGPLAGAVGLAKPTAHGLLRTLVVAGFVDQDPVTGRYQVGRDLLHLGSVTLDLNELRSVTLNWVDTLAARTGEEARIAAYRDGSAVVAHHVFRAGPGAQEMDTGRSLPLHATALGKVLIAFDPGAARSVVGQPLDQLAFRTITDRSQLLRALADARDTGWAAAVEEVRSDLAGIAAPVRDRGGYVVASVGIAGPVARLCDSQTQPRADLVAQVTGVARSISRALGHGRAAA
ncbi:IclR family transcriptional regulator [Nocardioides albertanoniae]|uniref:Glycerol operon regulatory protein n=1 Tax=Nocardioides albertanoniae TaxID=1175486 RepID=A0A543A1D8_9ACTN|nr:IclR family transcriptional regulator [Nocardioides albertanoniae]TQL66411.1 IclR family transcriptional regulator [Nocardioides albertanoniae]